MPEFGPSRALQAAIIQSLRGNANVAAVVGDRVFDGVPEGAEFPMISLGPSSDVDEELDCLSVEEHTQQIDVWSRDNSRMGPCKDIMDAVKAAIHNKPLILQDPYAVSTVRVLGKRIVKDPDGITSHGILTVTVMLEGG